MNTEDRREDGPVPNRVQWQSMSADERRAYANQNTQCIERGCNEPAGTPWGPLWCAEHDAQRLARISASLESIAASLR